MIQWITENIDKLLIGLGAAVVLFWPQIKKQIAGIQGGEQPKHHHDGCCCVPEPVQEKTRTEWVSDVMAVRTYVEKRKLPAAVEACDVLIHEIVSGRPHVEGASVTVTKVAR